MVLFAAPVAALGTARVTLPPGAFLQPTRSGEGVLQSAVGDALKGAKSVPTCFPVAAHSPSCWRAACGCTPWNSTVRRSRRWPMPCAPAGARAGHDRIPQSLPSAARRRRIGAIRRCCARPAARGRQCPDSGTRPSARPRIAYVSCNPVSFARDARVLTDAGFHLGQVTAVDQFLWSSHIELVAVFSRD